MRSDSFIEQQRRRQIIDCAIDLLVGGYPNASLHKIAQQLGISTGVISYHFGNKANLMAAIVEDVATTAVGQMLPKILACSTATAALRTLITSNLEFMIDHPQGLRALVEIVRHDLSAAGPGIYAAQANQAVVDVEKILVWGQQTGEFRDFDVRVVAVAVRAAIDQIPALLASDPDLDVAAYATELADLFDRATRRDPATHDPDTTQTHDTQTHDTQTHDTQTHDTQTDDTQTKADS